MHSATHLPLGWEVAISSGNTDDECVEASQNVGRDDGVIRPSQGRASWSGLPRGVFRGP